MTPSFTPTPQGGAARWYGSMMGSPRQPRQPRPMVPGSPPPATAAGVAPPPVQGATGMPIAPGGPGAGPAMNQDLLRMIAQRMMVNRAAGGQGAPPDPSLANAQASGLFGPPPLGPPMAMAQGGGILGPPRPSFWGIGPGSGPTSGFTPPSPGATATGIPPSAPAPAPGAPMPPSGPNPALAARMRMMQRPMGY